MKISELIAELERVKAERGDMECKVWSHDKYDGPKAESAYVYPGESWVLIGE